MSTIVPPDTWVDAPPCAPNDWIEILPPPPPGVPGVIVQKTLTLYYVAASGQTTFSLSAADLYGNTALLSATTSLAVTRNGARLTPDDGSGVGGYTIDATNNLVSLLWPAGAGEIILIDLFWVASPIPAPIANQTIGQDVLAVTVANSLPPLSRSPDGRVFVLFVEGRPFFATVVTPAFTYSGTTITWISTIYSVQPGNEVVALYTS